MPSQQEMVQGIQRKLSTFPRRVRITLPSRQTSPFWRSQTSISGTNSTKASASGIIVGASYSHADMLKLDSLHLTSESRPQTPSSSSRGNAKSSSIKPTSSNLSTVQQSHASMLRTGEEDDEEDRPLSYDAGSDEDEFGLPSLSYVRREGKRNSKDNIVKDLEEDYKTRLHHVAGTSSNFSTKSRARANSTDIALERDIPIYPSANYLDGKILKPQYKEILRDPANALHLVSHPITPSNATSKEIDEVAARISRINKFKRILQANNIALPELRDSAWSGLPCEIRAMSWQVLLGYLPTSSERRVSTLERKRKAYLDGVAESFMGGVTFPGSAIKGKSASTGSDRTRRRGLDEALWHQISIDVPRTSPHLQLYSYEATQRSLERILYVWAIRHPASGYVQGINDLLTPFWQVFLGVYVTNNDVSHGMDPGQLPKSVLDAVEADSFWCLTKLLDGIQDNYIFAQPGIVRQVGALQDLTTRIDTALAKHLEAEGVEFMQFSFRWMNCLLMRELSIDCIIRMWDTYMAEERGFSDFHLYVCAAFLVKWSDQLMKMDFQEIMMFLQSLPSKSWTTKDVELLLSEAYIWQSLFRGSSAHLRNTALS